VTVATSPATLTLGFLTVLHEPSGYLGGYLVTNTWGRPLEFRLSTAVQPNRVQQILYGGTLQPYICGDLIGKTLVDKTGVPVQLIATDCEPVLDLRLRIDVPVVWIAGRDDALVPLLTSAGALVRAARDADGPVFCHPRFRDDVHSIRELLDRLNGNLDLAEPFDRIREAISEARRMGVTTRG
jgi:pimeloyl-ACP methyl ester carboxylesterase